MKKSRFCLKCGFPLGCRPGLKDADGVCSACINCEKKKDIDYASRQKWLTGYIKENKGGGEYDCAVGVSGGKDSYMIVKRLIENHGVKNPLLITSLDEFEQTEAGKYNLRHIAEHFDLDHITFRNKPMSARKEMLQCFENELNALKAVDVRIVGFNGVPSKIARSFGIKLMFYGETNFEYGSEDTLEIFHKDSTYDFKYIFMGAIYPYSISDSLTEAKSVGFKDLDDFNEWNRYTVENYSQMDSYGYAANQWCKYVKFGAQRVADIACRLVRENKLSREEALVFIRERDFILDKLAKRDMCRVLGITEDYFDKVVDKFANTDIVTKDVDGIWKRKDIVELNSSYGKLNK